MIPQDTGHQLSHGYMSQQVQEYSTFINQHPNTLIPAAMRFSKFLGAQFASTVSEITPVLGGPPVLIGKPFLFFCQSLFSQPFAKYHKLVVCKCVAEQAVAMLSKVSGALFERWTGLGQSGVHSCLSSVGFVGGVFKHSALFERILSMISIACCVRASISLASEDW